MAAIYQWFEGIVEVQIWTTTLYPLEAAEGLKFDIGVHTASLDLIESDYYTLGMTFISMDVRQVLLTAPAEEDFLTLGMTFVDMDVISRLITAPPEEDFYILGMTLVDMDVIPKLITIYSPDQGLIMVTDLDTANCSFDLI